MPESLTQSVPPTQIANNIGIATICNPPVNSFSSGVSEKLLESFDEFQKARVRVIIIGALRAADRRQFDRPYRVRSQVMFMVNESRGVLSSLFECVHAHADLRTRRTTPFPAQVAAQIDALIDEHRALNWTAPVSGSMGLNVASSAKGEYREEAHS